MLQSSTVSPANCLTMQGELQNYTQCWKDMHSLPSLITHRMHLKFCLAVCLCLLSQAKNTVSKKTESDGMYYSYTLFLQLCSSIITSFLTKMKSNIAFHIIHSIAFCDYSSHYVLSHTVSKMRCPASSWGACSLQLFFLLSKWGT